MPDEPEDWDLFEDDNPEMRDRMAAQSVEVRRVTIARLAQMKDAGIRHVIWVSNCDEATCYRCRRRNGKKLTLAAARKLIDTDFCTATVDGYPAPCRCGMKPVVT